ncbi:hypothetical protein LAZ67_8000865 [Cordylochernes scorpioides]|uniref:Uncharacterized protein n=1 Tax=Cordylochernes scorpioides TaxID=51811 RepID=A0ABY6KQJ5_9ARAC|nr:hypothetical protein LAZ67_8000865 [Cordylochernes scorpioides]
MLQWPPILAKFQPHHNRYQSKFSCCGRNTKIAAADGIASKSHTNGAEKALNNWADAMEEEEEDGYTAVKNKKRRRDSATIPNTNS